MHANKRRRSRRSGRGHCRVAWVSESVHTGDTICDEKAPIVLEPMDFPEPVIRSRSNPRRSRSGEMGAAAQQAGRRRTRPSRSTPTGDGPDDHLREWGSCTWRSSRSPRPGVRVGVSVGKPQVAYKETIRQPAKAEGKYIKQTADAAVRSLKLEVSPCLLGAASIPETRSSAGGAQEYIKPIQEGIRSDAERADSPVLRSGKRRPRGTTVVPHEVDSSDGLQDRRLIGPLCIASLIPSWIGLMYSWAPRPPTISFRNSKPLPGGRGETSSLT